MQKKRGLRAGRVEYIVFYARDTSNREMDISNLHVEVYFWEDTGLAHSLFFSTGIGLDGLDIPGETDDFDKIFIPRKKLGDPFYIPKSEYEKQKKNKER